jgi:hypothetical protein
MFRLCGNGQIILVSLFDIWFRQLFMSCFHDPRSKNLQVNSILGDEIGEDVTQSHPFSA